MAKIYRAMKKGDDDQPRLGRSSTSLGVRVPTDISPNRHGNVVPGTGGMSVAPSFPALPALLIPKRLQHLAPKARGSSSNFVWTMGEGPFQESPIADRLQLRPDSSIHGTVEPDQPMPLQTFEDALSATRASWMIDETGR